MIEKAPGRAEGREGVRGVEIRINGSPEEIAALVLAVQGRQIKAEIDSIAEGLAKGISPYLSSSAKELCWGV